MYETALPTLNVPRNVSWSRPGEPRELIFNRRAGLAGESLADPHHQQVQYVAPIFFKHFECLAVVLRAAADAKSAYVMAQLSGDRAPRIRIANAEGTKPFTTVLKDPGCSMLHCGVYVWLTVTHGSLNVTRPDARRSSCVQLLASSPDHVLARSRHGLEMVIIPSRQTDLWSKDAAAVWATLTSTADTL